MTPKDLMSRSLTAPSQFIDPHDELIDAVFFDRQRRNDIQFVRGDARFVAAYGFRQFDHRLIAELVRLLYDGPMNSALFDPGQSRVFFVEGDDLHLADFAGLFDRAQNGRAVVRPESDHSGDVWILDQRVGGVPFGVHAFAAVGADVYDLDLRAFERLLQSSITILRVLRVHRSDKYHYPASLR